MKLDELLKTIPDKKDWLSTTSHKFKIDLYNFIDTNLQKDPIAIEFGTHIGHTTAVLSLCSEQVYTINWPEQNLDEAKRYHNGLGIVNIDYIAFDLYNKNNQLELECEIDLVFIDAGHDYWQVKMDFERVLNEISWADSECIYVAFDDVGVNTSEVGKFIEYLSEMFDGNIENTLIGHGENHSFGKGRIINKFPSEGIILKITKEIKQKYNETKE